MQNRAFYVSGDLNDVHLNSQGTLQCPGAKEMMEIRMVDNKPYVGSPLLILENCTTKSINLPGWKVITGGNCTVGGNITVDSLSIGGVPNIGF